jgi:drug/metabolite transporter (DMT)-like permease
MTKRVKAHLAVLAANFIFGANFSVVKYVTPSVIQPIGLNLLRVVVTTSLFWMLFLANPSSMKIDRKDVLRFIACGAAGVALNQMLFIKGLSLSTSIHAALLMLATPIIITFIAAWLLHEKLNAMKFAGLALGIAGAVNLILQKEASQSAPDIITGDIFILVNAILYGLYFVMVKPLMQKYTGLQVIRWVFTIGLFIILPFGWNQFTATNWAAITTDQWAALAFIVIGSTFFAYLFNIYGLSELGASATGAYIYTQPVFAAVIAILLMGEAFTWSKAVSAVLIFTGVFLANKKTAAAHKTGTSENSNAKA